MDCGSADGFQLNVTSPFGATSAQRISGEGTDGGASSVIFAVNELAPGTLQ